jgi:nitroreductase
MNILRSINTRRSIKAFTDRPVPPKEIEQLLNAVCQAPNHRKTEPWRFYVLGPDARHAYGEALGRRKAKRMEDVEAGQAVVDKVALTHKSLPAMVAVAVVVDENPEIREEDFAAVYMGIQNLSLVAHAIGLGTHIKTGAIMDDPAARAALGVPEGQRIVATINIGKPDGLPDPQSRRPASELTTWVE